MTTYVVTKNIIRQIVSDIATAHYQINSFGYGDEADYVQKLMNEDTQELAENVIYPRLFLSPDVSRIQTGSYIRTYVVIVADRIRTGDQNFTEVESDTEQILLDVIAQLQNQDYGFVLDTGSIEVTPFKNRFADMVTGHMASISLQSDFEYDRCQIPESFITVTNPYVPFTNGSNERDPLSWHKQGNALTTSSVIGSTNNQDWRIIQNSLTIATIKAAGVQLDVLNAKATPGTIFLTTDNGVITSRTAAEVLSDIGAAPAIPTFTEGSVLFAGTGGVISQDAGVFNYDSTNKRVSIGGAISNNILRLYTNQNADDGAFISNTNASNAASAYFIGQSNAGQGGFLVHSTAHGAWSATTLYRSTTANGTAILNSQAAPIDFYTQNSFRGRWSSTGNLLIGNTAGVGRLNVRGAGTTSSTYTAQFHNSTGTSNSLVIRDDGNVGFGTSSPEARIDFGNNVNQSIYLFNLNSDRYGINSTQYDGQLYSLNLFSGNGGFIKFRTASGSSVPETRMTINQVGSVGIGTTEPNNAKLQIKESVGSGFAVKITNRNDTRTWGIAVDATSIDDGKFMIADNTGNVERFVIDTNGYVGIGTTTPTARLTVKGAGTTSSTFTAQFHNSTGTSNSLVIRDDGKVGIGTSSPTRGVHMVGNGLLSDTTYTATANNDYGWNFTGTLAARVTANDTFNGVLINPQFQSGAAVTQEHIAMNLQPTFDSSSYALTAKTFLKAWDASNAPNDFFKIQNITASAGQVIPAIISRNTGNTADRAGLFIIAEITRDNVDSRAMNFVARNSSLGALTSANLFEFRNASTVVSKVTAQGNWIIGNSATASARLHVKGAGTTSATFTAQFHNSTGANNALVIRDDGRVGIGTSAPDNALHVEQANTFSQARIRGSSSNNAGGLLVQNNSTQSLFVEVTGTTEGSNPSSGIIYASGGLTKIQLGSGRGVPLFTLLTATGNVGIGTASPSARLHVVGADTLSGTNALLVQNSAAQNILQLNNANEIGFYGAAPVARQTINSGSTAAVLAEVVAALENLGLLIDNT